MKKTFNTQEEIWKSCENAGFPNYEVSTLGRVRNIKTGKILSLEPSKNGYVMYCLYNKHIKIKVINAGRLVKLVFEPIENMEIYEIDHIDRNKLNNNINNLRWVTKIENIHNRTKENKRGPYHKSYYIIYDDETFELFHSLKECDMPIITIFSLLKDGHHSNKYGCRAFYVGNVPEEYDHIFSIENKIF